MPQIWPDFPSLGLILISQLIIISINIIINVIIIITSIIIIFFLLLFLVLLLFVYPVSRGWYLNIMGRTVHREGLGRGLLEGSLQ